MANYRRDKSGLGQQFEKLKQQVPISFTPIARAKRSLWAIARLDTVGRVFAIKRIGVIKQLECDRYPIPDSNATRPQTSTMGV
ncbi:hypothetical protein SAMD00079811_58750 [Scytonema sp. HK-05]|uniref:hypothetical protein n=1 Tax=Scytonema sp. HK-05 TaxID=1137095 RepID=UPI000935950B|nr:hypothetical protein [Scytonema sp. HK-05]OKH53474.1 hypothetical protein NIES2130_30445 [Scytonema sp. HK-05]BAY48254.1 hypothetical protein SAMD00079811_58750 [Scytonema sp. HK-05]